LGNPEVMKNKSDKERNRVCDLYEDIFAEWIKTQYKPVIDMLNLIYFNNQIGDVHLECSCAPKRCHCDTPKAYLDGSNFQQLL